MRYFCCLLALAFTLPAYAQKAPPHKAQKTKTALAAKAKVAPEPVLVFQRTPCEGRCPAYTTAIFANGRVEYDGLRSVQLLGKHTLSLPAATVSQMLAEAKRLHFTELKDEYSGNTTDMPATIIKVHPVGQPLKAVYAEQDIPQNLQEYINYLKTKLDPLTQNTQEQ
ncbi:MAG: DUF6438 domain-containing protein [Janthinobacterium lividum]